MTEPDPFALDRFVEAQEGSFQTALDELRAGRKRSHWMWFIFPQLRGLGRSWLVDFYGLGSIEEARAFLDHSILGPRLVTCTEAVIANRPSSPHVIFGSPDDAKFWSSMTVFAIADTEGTGPFRHALAAWFEGQFDDRTVELLVKTRRTDLNL
jgi:uncharacterized protein (DUF1810 family)